MSDAGTGSRRCSSVLAALLAAPLFVGWVNQCRAWLQNKSAPELWLPYRGIRKLFHKDAVIARQRLAAVSARALRRVRLRWCCAAAIIPSMGTRPAVHARRRRDRAGRPVRHGARVHVARRDGRRHRVRHARRAARDDGRLPRRAGAADGDLRRVADLASRRRCRRSRRRSATQTLALYPSLAFTGRRVHDGAARRERAHPGRQSGHAPRAHDDPRGDAARVLGAPPGADGMGRGAQALQLRLHRLRAVRAVGHRHRRGAGSRCSLALPLLAAKLAAGRRRPRADRNGVGQAARLPRAGVSATAFLLAVLGLLVHLLLGA